MTQFRMEFEVNGDVLGYSWSGPMEERSFSWWTVGRGIARCFARRLREKAKA